ncbi:MAG: patatin-like phospholipase family protein [Solirubrobacteraceae bacterium]
MRDEVVALVLGGGGARGAYEAGVLSVLLPVLEERGERPRLLLGTSAGALNVGFLAANAHRTAADCMPDALTAWESMRWGEVARRLVSIASVRRISAYAGEVLGVCGSRIPSLLDPQPLRATLREWIDFAQIEENARTGFFDAAGVVATSAHTGRSVVFHNGSATPPSDGRRGIDYVTARLAAEHVLASAAIPAIFPAVRVTRPRRAEGWYLDGGTRLNTPIAPALELGAERVVVIAATSAAPGGADLAGAQRPDALEGAGQILIGLLEDQLSADVRTLATINALIAGRAGPGTTTKRRVPYILIVPAERDPIADRALRVVREHYSGALQALTSDVGLLAKLTAAGADAQHAALLSFLLFTSEFARALIELGQQDAQRWIHATHELDGLWQVGPLSTD